MFGYVKINKPELKIKEYDRYKSYYCGLCHILKKEYGTLGQLSLNYDITFLIIVLSALYECRDTVVTGRCKSSPVKPVSKRINEMTEYAAAMNILLTYYHCDDNWRDERSKVSLIYRETLHGSAVKAAKRYPVQAAGIRRELRRLTKLERDGTANIDELAACFGRLMAGLFAYRRDDFYEHLYQMGFALGKFIYIMDAYEDLEKDIAHDSFNPFKEIRNDTGFDEFIRNALNIIMAECIGEFEMLPVIQDEEIIRNILYAGVWQRYNKIFDEHINDMKGKDKNDE